MTFLQLNSFRVSYCSIINQIWKKWKEKFNFSNLSDENVSEKNILDRNFWTFWKHNHLKIFKSLEGKILSVKTFHLDFTIPTGKYYELSSQRILWRKNRNYRRRKCWTMFEKVSCQLNKVIWDLLLWNKSTYKLIFARSSF